MKYSEAELEARGIEREPGYIRFDLNHNTYLILPHSAGIKLLEALEQAEYLYTSYSIIPEIRPMEADDLPLHLMAPEERRRLHMAQLLRVPVCELDRVKAEEQPPPF
jgi:hypothetical protein